MLQTGAPSQDGCQPGDDAKGIISATCIVLFWSSSLVFLLTRTLTLSSWWVPLAVLWQTFWFTGLFITAHDSMHGTVSPSYPSINKAFGWLSVGLYALFSYEKLSRWHGLHHKHSGTDTDPDYHDGVHSGALAWYVHFLRNYVHWTQIVGMAIIFNVMIHVFHLDTVNVLLFWVAPSLLSTVQLFIFGTYLPHRETTHPFQDNHHARSSDFSLLLSFLTCYHFGYHWEHHKFPWVPWWRLPSLRYSEQVTRSEPKAEPHQSSMSSSGFDMQV